MFHVIEKELRWRKEHNMPEGFDALTKAPPIVAVGADQPLGDQMVLADYFRTFKSFNLPIRTKPLNYVPIQMV